MYDGKYDDRYAFPGLFKLLRCQCCGHGFIDTTFDKDFLRKLYTEYYPRSSYNVEAHQPHKEIRAFRAWLTGARALAFRWIPRNVRVLDIGCGFGETLGYHRARGCDAFGVEADENILRIAERYGYDVHAGLFDPSLFEPGSFDYVTLDQVIEHVNDPVDTLRGIAHVLRPKSTLILSTPNADGWGAHLFGRYWINWHVPYHQHFFSRASLTLAAEKANLELVEVRSVTPSVWLYYQWVHLMTRPGQGVLSSFWSPGARRTLKDKICIKLLRLLHYSLIDHFAARIADYFNAGDNRVFVFRKKKAS